MFLRYFLLQFVQPKKCFHSNSCSNLQAHYKMCDRTVHKAIVRYEPNAYRVALQFPHNIGNKIRTFNMNRRASEEISSVLCRVKTNLMSKLNTKQNKRAKNKPAAQAIEEYTTKLFKVSVPLDVETIDFESVALCDEVDGARSCVDVFVTDAEQHLLQLGAFYYRLEVNPPEVENISLPSNIMAGFVLYPNYLDLRHAKIRDCSTRWFTSEKVFTDYQVAKGEVRNLAWQEIHQGFVMTTTEEMIGKLIKVRTSLPVMTSLILCWNN